MKPPQLPNKTQLRKLRRLAAHIIDPTKRKHKVFDFSCYNLTKNRMSPANNSCGTLGCAFGELPAVWPKVFKWEGNMIQYRKPSPYYRMHSTLAKEFFGLSDNDFFVLFHPKHQSLCTICELPTLERTATAEQVAANIITFCDAADKLCRSDNPQP